MADKDFRRIAIVNRGECAMRLIHAVREYNVEHDAGLRTIALYTDPERRAMFVREADEAHCLGPASYVDEADGQRKNAYLNYAAIEEALLETRADAVWVGWGFVAEHPAFADLCEKKLGLTFIGPDGDCMRRVGDKITSKQMAEKAGVPVAPWSGGPVADLDEAHTHAERIGMPLMVKATAGGGGRGIRTVRSPGELDEAFRRASSEALGGFGNATVFMERLVEGARHIEVQVIADAHGNVWSVGVRDCSVQRRHQKLIEESSSPVLTAEQIESIKDAAARLCREAGYRNAGTVEFLYDPREREFAFMEVNARLQVEHPVTEVSTDLDMVKLQIHVARGGTLEGEPPVSRGTAIEIRLNAEDPQADFAPAPGKIELLRLPTGAGVRIDTGVEVGDRIPAEFDSMIAKIIAHGRDRDEALSRLRRALSELAVVVRGGTTNRAFLLELLGMNEVISGSADVGWLDREPPAEWKRKISDGEIAVALAGVQVAEQEFDAERKLFLAAAARGRPRVRTEVGRTMELRYGGNLYNLRVLRYGRDLYRVDVDGHSLRLTIEHLGTYERRVTCRSRMYRTLCVRDGVAYAIEVNGSPHKVFCDDGGAVRAPSPSVVVSLKVKPGDSVTQGDTLAILEAMKLEMRVTSPFTGIVKHVAASENEQLDAGAPILTLQPEESGEQEDRGGRLEFDKFSEESRHELSVEQRCRASMQELQHLVLGFDVGSKDAERLIAGRAELCTDVRAGDPVLRADEDELLKRFADVCALSQRRPARESARLPTRVIQPSPQQSLFTYMRNLEQKGSGLSRHFIEDLKRALRHYGIDDLEPTRQLEEALLWIHRSHSRVEQQIPAVLSILDRRLRHIDALLEFADEEFREVLDRLVEVSGLRYPAVSDLAREVRYAYFDKPLFDATRRNAYIAAERLIDYLAKNPDASDREDQMKALVNCPQPLMTLLSDHFVGGEAAMRELAIECLTRRYYRIRELESLHITHSDEQPFVTAEYDHEDERITLITTHARYNSLVDYGHAAIPIIRNAPLDHGIVLDFYIHREDAEESEEDTREYVRQALDAIPFPRTIRRIVTSVRIPGAGLGIAGQRYFTWRHSESGYWEETAYSGIHPMMAKRLHLWRFNNFNLERLPSVEDVYLFRATAKENPGDERLFAVAEVRDLTAVRDEDGRVVALPYLEYMFQQALAGIRVFQAQRPVRKRLFWNRVLLYVWPPMDLSISERSRMIRKLLPATRGLGLEQVRLRGLMARRRGEQPRDTIAQIWNPSGHGPTIELLEPRPHAMEPLSPYRQKVLKMRQRGLMYPYEIIRLLTPDREHESHLPEGEFVEYDMGEDGRLEPVERRPGGNTASIIVGVVKNITDKYPEGMTRVMILGDPTRGMCPLAEPECSRIIAALDMAEEMGVPVEWFAVSAGAKIAMDSGTENLDWTASVLRRLIEFTQDGGEVNVIVYGVNVGAQSYWNAEATMLMHTRGILIMTPQGAMVLTGKQALDYSGGVSAEDNLGIGGYDRIMGPNGQAQYWAADIEDACQILLRHYDHSYHLQDERFPRKTNSTDPADRDVTEYAYDDAGNEFKTIGEIFSDEHNPGRKRPFQMRSVMRAVVDQDRDPLERWSAMRDAEIGIVWDAHLGGRPVCLIGIESRPLSRTGLVPADGPDQWTAGTLFPGSSRKVARAINAASDNRPVVVLANLSGFDGSPESMREWQLEYGAEIGRAMVNFKGPAVFCVVSRYHGGAFVVFSKALNANLQVAALEGAYASVIGGAPAAAVVFARDVKRAASEDPRVVAMGEELKSADGAERARLHAEYDQLLKQVQIEKRAELAEKFDTIHSVQRAMDVGSIDAVIEPGQLRRYLIEAVERGIDREITATLSADPSGTAAP